MADLQEQLQTILGDPQAMSQITAIAKALTGSPPEGGQQPPKEPPQARDVEFVSVEQAQVPEIPESSGPSSGSPGPDLSALLGTLGGGGLPDIDPKLIQIALRVFSEYSAQDDQKAALLSSLKPFLKEERREKMEKAEKIARLSRVVRVAIQLLKEGDSHV